MEASMRKIQTILLGTFLGGVLLGGVGAGIALVEYSSFSYGGEKLIGYENLVTDHFDFQFDPEKGVIVADAGYWGERTQTRLMADESVPENVVRYEVTYNKKQIEPFLDFVPAQEGISGFQEAEHKQGMIEFLVSSQGSDLEVFMECKDELLKEIKEKKISSYDMAYITKINVLVNPETMEYVEMTR